MLVVRATGLRLLLLRYHPRTVYATLGPLSECLRQERYVTHLLHAVLHYTLILQLERNDTHVQDVEQQDKLAREEMEGTPNKLAAFPQDLWVKSLLCLHWRDLLQFKQVSSNDAPLPASDISCIKACRLFSDIVNHSIALLYKLELRQAALVDGTSRAQYRAKLQILCDLQRHWRKLRLSLLLSGVLPLQHLFSVLPCGILAQRATPQSIELRLLPSHLRGRSSPEVWKVITVPDVSNVEGFCVDPVQDLLVVAERLNLPAEYGSVSEICDHIPLADTFSGEFTFARWSSTASGTLSLWDPHSS